MDQAKPKPSGHSLTAMSSICFSLSYVSYCGRSSWLKLHWRKISERDLVKFLRKILKKWQKIIIILLGSFLSITYITKNKNLNCQNNGNLCQITNLATWFLDFAKVTLCTLSRETCHLINLRTTIGTCSNHLTLSLLLRLTRCERRVVDRWSDRHGESGTSGLRSFPPGRRTPAAAPWRFPSQTGETWPCLPGQMTEEPARTTAPAAERATHSIGQSFVYMNSCEHLVRVT